MTPRLQRIPHASGITVLPEGRDLVLESLCNVKRFLALVDKFPDWLEEASAEQESKKSGSIMVESKNGLVGSESDYSGEKGKAYKRRFLLLK